MADAASVRLRRYLRRRFTAAGVNDGAPPRRCPAARHRAPCAAAGGGGRDGHAGRSGGPSAALAISPVWGWRRFAFRRRGGPPRRPHHGSSRAARRLEAGIPGRPTVRAQRRPSLTRRPTTRRLALAPSLPAPTVVHAKTAAAGRGPPRLGPSAAPWGRRALHPHHRHSQPTRKPVGGGATPQPAPVAPPSLTLRVPRASFTRPPTPFGLRAGRTVVCALKRRWARLEHPPRPRRSATGQHHPRHP